MAEFVFTFIVLVFFLEQLERSRNWCSGLRVGGAGERDMSLTREQARALDRVQSSPRRASRFPPRREDR